MMSSVLRSRWLFEIQVPFLNSVLFLAVGRLSLVAASGATLQLRRASFLLWFLLLRSVGSRHTGFSSTSCNSWALEWGLVVAVHGLSCPSTCGIFLDQELNLSVDRQILNRWTIREVQIQVSYPAGRQYEIESMVDRIYHIPFSAPYIKPKSLFGFFYNISTDFLDKPTCASP